MKKEQVASSECVYWENVQLHTELDSYKTLLAPLHSTVQN